MTKNKLQKKIGDIKRKNKSPLFAVGVKGETYFIKRVILNHDPFLNGWILVLVDRGGRYKNILIKKVISIKDVSKGNKLKNMYLRLQKKHISLLKKLKSLQKGNPLPEED